jgi:hypothetical protein
VAADERSVNATVYRLLKGFLARSVWLYAICGVAAYMMSGAFWALRIQRIPLVGIWLGLWGSIAAFNSQNLVWRSLPIALPNIALYRWWTAVAAPGCFLTALIVLSWGVQLSARLPAPDGLQVLLDVLVNWAALALVAASWDGIRCSTHQSKVAAVAKTLLLVAIGAMSTGYGLPIEADSLAGVGASMGAGLVLLVLGALRAQRTADKHWVFAASGGHFSLPWHRQGATQSTLVGLKVLYVPALRYGLILAALTSLGLVIANKLVSYDKFPHAATILLIFALVVHSTATYVLNHRLRTSAHLLRCLPLSVNRLAGLLQIITVLPGLIAAMATLLTVRWTLHFNINMWVASSFALTLFGSLGIVNQSERWQEQQVYRGPLRWLPLIQSLLVPGWFGIMATVLAVDTGIWSSSRFGLIGWVCLGLGVFFFALGHLLSVRHLRAGIRPSASQTSFSVA